MKAVAGVFEQHLSKSGKTLELWTWISRLRAQRVLEGATPAEFATLAETVGQQCGRLDVLLHAAAAFSGLTPLDSLPAEDWLPHVRGDQREIGQHVPHQRIGKTFHRGEKNAGHRGTFDKRLKRRRL